MVPVKVVTIPLSLMQKSFTTSDVMAPLYAVASVPTR